MDGIVWKCILARCTYRDEFRTPERRCNSGGYSIMERARVRQSGLVPPGLGRWPAVALLFAALRLRGVELVVLCHSGSADVREMGS